jgi:hypothetical protein
MRAAFALASISLIAPTILALPVSDNPNSALVTRQISDAVIKELYQRSDDIDPSQFLERRFV